MRVLWLSSGYQARGRKGQGLAEACANRFGVPWVSTIPDGGLGTGGYSPTSAREEKIEVELELKLKNLC